MFYLPRMRFSLRKFLAGSVVIIVSITFWNVIDFSSEVERSGRSYLNHVCRGDMWQNFENKGDMSFPWKPVDDILQHRSKEISCDEMYTVPRVNMSLIPPSANPRVETVSFGGSIEKLTNDARFFYFILRAKAFPYNSRVEQMPIVPVTCSSDKGLKIPNAIHFLWQGDEEFGEIHYLSIRSAAAIHGPTVIMFHLVKSEPHGAKWEQILADVPCLRIATIQPLYNFAGNTSFVKRILLKLQILHNYGGIYVDFGVMFLKPFHNLMKHKIVLGRDHGHIQHSVMMAEIKSPFINRWMKSFANYSYRFPTEHLQIIPSRLSSENPNYGVKYIDDKLTAPSYIDGIEWLTNKNRDLHENYCASLNYRSFMPASLPFHKLNRSALIHLDSTYGQMVRKVLFGSFHLEIFETNLDEHESLMKRNANMRCNKQTMRGKIPLLLHVVLLDEEFNYYQYIAVRLAMKFVHPHRVIFHRFVNGSGFESNYFIRIKREIKCVEILTINSIDSSYIPVYKNNLKKRFDIISSILSQHGGVFLGENTLIKQFFPIEWYDNSITVQHYDPDHPFAATQLIIAEKGCNALKVWLGRNPTRSFYRNGIQSLVDNSEVKQVSMVTQTDERIFFSPNLDEKHKNVPGLFFEENTIKDTLLETNEYELIRSNAAYGSLARESFYK